MGQEINPRLGCVGKGLDLLEFFLYQLTLSLSLRPRGSPSRGVDAAVDVFDINQPSSPTPLSSVLVSVCVFTPLSTVFHSINSPDKSPLFHSVLPVLFLPYCSFQLYTSL